VVPVKEHHKAARITIRQWLQQHTVHNREGCRGRADAERQSQDSQESECGLASQQPARMAHVAKQEAQHTPFDGRAAEKVDGRCRLTERRLRNRSQILQSQASARARRNARSRALRVSAAAAVNSERASGSRPARNRKSPLAAGNGA